MYEVLEDCVTRALLVSDWFISHTSQTGIDDEKYGWIFLLVPVLLTRYFLQVG